MSILRKTKINGVFLEHNKNTVISETKEMPIPDEVEISMSHHIGAPCIPMVQIGEMVCTGQLIGESTPKFGPPIHSSVSGEVTAIRNISGKHGEIMQSVVIKTDKQQTLWPQLKKPILKSKEDFITAVYDSGLSGLGGAGFPAHIKLNVEYGHARELLINAAECEPYITSDYREMMECPEDIIKGINLVCEFLGIEHGIICIEDNKPEAIAMFQELCANEPLISVRSLPSIYPHGAEKALIYSVTGKIVPEGGLPMDIGTIVMNVTSIAELYRYIATGIPLILRRITVDGNIVNRPGNIWVPIGAKTGDIIEFCGGLTEPYYKLLFGGPMMGASIPDISEPILKTTNAILAFDKDIEIHTKTTACIRCGKCISVCPVHLMPVELEKAHDNASLEELRELSVDLCIDCGCCSYICPSKRQLVWKHRHSKQLIKADSHTRGEYSGTNN